MPVHAVHMAGNGGAMKDYRVGGMVGPEPHLPQINLTPAPKMDWMGARDGAGTPPGDADIR